MVNKFLEKDDTPKPTIAMDYSFGRKVGKNLVSFMKNVKNFQRFQLQGDLRFR